MTTQTIYTALIAAGVDSDAINETPDGLVTVRGVDGSRFSLGDDGTDDNGTQWWTGTTYSADNEPGGTDSWTSLERAAHVVAEWAS